MSQRNIAHLLSIVALATWSGCIQVRELASDAGSSSSDAGPPLETCTVTDVLAGNTPLTVPDGSVDTTYHGSWLHLSHPAGVAATLHVEVLDAASPGDGGTAVAGGYLASAGWPRTDGLGGLTGLVTPTTLRLYAPEQDLFLFPSGSTFRVRVCEQPDVEPFPACDQDPAGCEDVTTIMYEEPSALPGACACMPDCATSADCPLPSTGDVTPSCVGGNLCALPCDAASTCPDGQVCVEAPEGAGFVGSFCMTAP